MNSGGKNLNGATILLAMKELGRELGEGHSIEMVIVGGAAGLLGHILPGTITTSDVDAIHFRPPEDVEDVLRAAETVADKQRTFESLAEHRCGAVFQCHAQGLGSAPHTCGRLWAAGNLCDWSD